MKNLALAFALVSLVSFAQDPQIKFDSDKVPTTGYVGELVKDARFLALDIDLREKKPESAALSYEQWVSLLDLPIVHSKLEQFVSEAVVGDSHLQFSFNEKDADKIVKELLTRLAEKNADPKGVGEFIGAITGGDPLLTLTYTQYFQQASQKPTKALEKVITTLSKAKDVSIRHTTRGIEPKNESKAAVPGFEPFFSGRFGVAFKDENGSEQFLVVQTESLLGHLKPVIPGTTRVDGSIAVSDSGYTDAVTTFTQADLKTLLQTLHKAWGSTTDDSKKLILGAVAAVYANGDLAKLKRAIAK